MIQQDDISVKIRIGVKKQVVYINYICPLLQKDTSESEGWTLTLLWHVDSGDDYKAENPAVLRKYADKNKLNNYCMILI